MTANNDFAGARWWKFDFHTHTPASRDTYWHGRIGEQDALSPEQWLLKHMAAGIDCVAITDHNTGKWIDGLKATYARLQQEPPEGFRPLYLFPGVEITVNGGFHLLAIFDPETPGDETGHLLGRVGYEGTRGDCDDTTRESAAEVVRLAHEAGAIAIPAHVEGPKGLLELCKEGGNSSRIDAHTVKQVLCDGRILAAEVIDSGVNKPQIYHDEKCDWTEVVGSDCHSFQGDAVPGSRFTWVKMCQPSLEGLRLALLDGTPLSIQRHDRVEGDPNDHAQLFIEQIEIRNLTHAGRVRPLTVRFSPWLTTLIGGRGTGKSTVIELLRLALRRENELPGRADDRNRPEARGNFDRTLAAMLKDASVSLIVRKDGGQFRVGWDKAGALPVIEEETEDGQWQAVPGEVDSRFPVRIFSQKQVYALTENSGALLTMIDESREVDGHQWAGRWSELRATFLRLRGEIRELEARLGDQERLKGELEDLKRQIAIFESGDNRELLRSYQKLRRQQAAFDERAGELDQAVDKLRALSEEIAPADPRPGDFDVDNPIEKAAVELLNEAAAEERGVRKTLDTLAAKLQGWRREWQEKEWASRWFRHKEKVEQEYRQLVERLREEGVADPSAYGSLVQRRTMLGRQLAELDDLVCKKEKIQNRIQKILDQIEACRSDLSNRRQQFLTKILGDNPYVHISVVSFGNRARGAEDDFREVIDRTDGRLEDDILNSDGVGILAELFAGLPENDDDRCAELQKRLNVLKTDLENIALGGKPGTPRGKRFLTHMGKLPPERIDRLLLWWPADALKIQYRKPDGKFADLQHGSPGQKSAAILAFLLLHGDKPLILDQPEDDLDNHLIYDLIVSQLRDNKRRRQVIVATHNPNIVVNGDAEMVNAMDQVNGQCVVLEPGSGCLQSRDVRDEICRVMEGGREAFEQRYRRLLEK
ncbi:chromosome partition protein Smc [bacterium BMS3Bbin12]|nr:chromosome partition protein Smc [bacterium BMS3Bbin12]GBE49669.1 chromosome partition protein Smc [bacterium BMS3Bbin13]